MSYPLTDTHEQATDPPVVQLDETLIDAGYINSVPDVGGVVPLDTLVQIPDSDTGLTTFSERLVTGDTPQLEDDAYFVALEVEFRGADRTLRLLAAVLDTMYGNAVQTSEAVDAPSSATKDVLPEQNDPNQYRVKDAAQEQEFTDAVLQYDSLIFHSMVRQFGNRLQREVIQENLQEAWINAYLHWNQFRPGTNRRGWLFRIASNINYTYIVKLKRQVAEEPVDPLFTVSRSGDTSASKLDLESEVSPSGEDQALIGLNAPLAQKLKRLISPIFLPVVWLYDVEGLQYKEIAEVLGVPMGTVMSRLSRGRSQLRERLGGKNFSVALETLDAMT